MRHNVKKQFFPIVFIFLFVLPFWGCGTSIDPDDSSTGSGTTSEGIRRAGDRGPDLSGDSTNGFEEPLGVAVDGTGVYVVGYDVSTPLPLPNRQWRIEKRDLTTGDLISAFGNNGVVTSNLSHSFDQATGVALDSNVIYIAGFDTSPSAPLSGINSPPVDGSNSQWRIEKRNSSDGSLVTTFGNNGAVTSNPSSGLDDSFGIFVSSSRIFVVGYDTSLGPSNPQLRMEKREISDGKLDVSFGSGGGVTNNPTSGNEAFYGIAGDSTGIYLVGRDNPTGNHRWRVEKRNTSNGNILWTQVFENSVFENEVANAITVDGSGIYIVGYDQGTTNQSTSLAQWRIEKRNINDGTFITAFGNNGIVTNDPSTSFDQPLSVVIDSTGLYIAGYDSLLGPGNQQWRLEKRNQTNGTLIWAQTSNPSSGPDIATALSIDATGIYVVGYDSFPSENFDSQWRIEKRNLTDGSLIWVQTVNPTLGS